MSATDRKLDALTSELTAKERSILYLRAWCAGEKADERLMRLCPPHERAEVERICRAVEHASSEAHGLLIIFLEWTAVAESDLQALRVLNVYQSRVSALEKVATAKVAPLPPPWEVRRLVPVGWGRLIRNDEHRLATDWDEFWLHRLLEVEASLSLRWRDVLGFEGVFEDIAKAMGEPLIHVEAKERMGWLEEHVVRLAALVTEWDEDFSLPEEPGEHGALLRESIDWDAIQGTPKEKHAREWMPEKQRADLEAWEQEQAEALRRR